MLLKKETGKQKESCKDYNKLVRVYIASPSNYNFISIFSPWTNFIFHQRNIRRRNRLVEPTSLTSTLNGLG